MTSSNDSVMGEWTFTPDDLNRLVGATNVPVPIATSPTSYYCWSYDAFGNRNLQAVSSASFASPAPACTPSGGSYQGVWAHYAAGSNRFSNTQQALGGVGYDGAGNIVNDGVNQYLYDGDGRICAVASGSTGEQVLTGYIYNAEGERVSKGSLTAWSCDPGVNGFKPLSDYVVGLSGEQVTEMGMNPSGSMAWQHTNVYAFGEVMATYDNDGLHFYLNDALGTRRAQTDYAGVPEQTCMSLPFGDALNCTNSLQFPTEHHFTGKERDAESGNDYFGARYYASSLGRFMSPDWSASPEPVPYADLTNPQSLNLYGYVNNNPSSKLDKDGHCCWNYVAGTVGGLLNLVPNTVNFINDATNAAISPFTSFRFSHLDTIQSDANASAAGIATGEALQMVVPISDVGKGGQILENAAKGAASEARVLDDLGIAKNTEAVTGTEGKSIPDFQSGTTVGEIKDAKTVSNTKQLRIQKEAAADTGRQHELHTGANTNVTPNAANGTTVVRRPDLGPQ
jgi:RHS repeat-associated protein